MTEINQALIRPGVSVKQAAETFSLDRTTLWRHSTRCVKTAIAKALEKQAVITGSALISESCNVRATVANSLQHVADAGQHRDVAPLATAYIKTSEFIARLAGLDGFKQTQSTTLQVAAGQGGQVFIALPQAAEPLAIKGAGASDVITVDPA